MTGDQNFAILVTLFSFILNRHLPLSEFFLPMSPNHSSIELYVAINIPFPGRVFDIGVDLGPTGIKPSPVWIRVEWKCLDELEPSPPEQR